jgi:hypothetical protein
MLEGIATAAAKNFELVQFFVLWDIMPSSSRFDYFLVSIN